MTTHSAKPSVRSAAAVLAVLVLAGSAGSLQAGQDAGATTDPATDTATVPEPAASDPVPAAGTWTLSVGIQGRTLGDVRFSGGSRSAALELPSFFGRSARRLPVSIGRSDAVVDRQYDDGFVGRDAGTAEDGLTWNWGYQSASQVEGDSLRFRRGGGGERVASAASAAATQSWSEDPGDAAGPVVRLSYARPVTEGMAIAGDVGVSLAGFDVERRGITNFRAVERVSRSEVIAWDRFDLDGVVPPPPPYSGTAEGPGPVISNRPEGRGFARVPTGRESIEFRNRVDESFELDLISLGLGGEFRFRHGAVYVALGGGGDLHVADWEAKRREVLVRSGGGPVATWNDRASDTDLIGGVHVRGTVGIALGSRLTLELFGQHDWAESLRGRVGPSSFDADLDGWSGGVLVGFRF